MTRHCRRKAEAQEDVEHEQVGIDPDCGSSSPKFAVMDAETGEDMLSGLANASIWMTHVSNGNSRVKGDAMLGAGAAHQEALDPSWATSCPRIPPLADQLVAIGHRIVHGGEQFSCPCASMRA